MNDRIHVLAKAELQRTDWRLMRALERSLAGEDWCTWRDELRRLIHDNEGVEDIPAEPPFGGAVAAPAPEPDPEPETHFADLMLADETIDDAKARLSQRLKELRHYLIAPEIRVNEDGSLGLTTAEQAELQDLERRQTLGRWLEA